MAAGLLDDVWDDALEDAVRAAAAAVDTPMAAVSVLTPHLQVFIAHVGLPLELEIGRALSRDIGLCHRAVAAGSVVVVGDLSAGGGRPELTDIFGVRAWVGAPLVVDGAIVATLCCFDSRARTFEASQTALLARIVGAIEARLATRARNGADVDVATAEVLPYLRLTQAVQVGALTPEALARALRVLPTVPLTPPPSK